MKFGRRRDPAPGGTSGVEGEQADADSARRTPTPARLRRERRMLIAQRQEDVYHLGGLAFELYRRDLLGPEVLDERALAIAELDGRVRAIDAQIEDLDAEHRARRGRRSRTDGAVGACLACRSDFRSEAVYCWHCGAEINPGAGLSDQDTAVLGPLS